MAKANLTRLRNHIQPYHWGTKTSIALLLNNADLITNQPVAEYWIGTHPSLPSKIAATNESLPEFLLSKTNSSGSLPFLFKLLSAQSPLSIQVHPNKSQAENGFLRENQQGLALDAPNRNYKDDNHKPETMIALTAFEALIGFRSRTDIIRDALVLDNALLSQQIIALSDYSEDIFLQRLTQWLLEMPPTTLEILLDDLLAKQVHLNLPTLETLADLFSHYEYDFGVLMALLMNKVTLMPGEAVFLEAGIPHAYLQGTGIEVMATSDNVLRAGLTPKHVDEDELMQIVQFQHHPVTVEKNSTAPGVYSLPSPKADYKIQHLVLEQSEETAQLSGQPEILFLLEGQITCEEQSLCQGESFVIHDAEGELTFKGTGQLYRIYSQLSGVEV